MRKETIFTGKILGLMLAGLFLTQTPVLAGVYMWQDDQRKIHFTDNKSNIPLQYLTKKSFKLVIGSDPFLQKKQVHIQLASLSDVTVQEEAAQVPQVQEEGEPAPAMSPKLVAMLTETKLYLENENRAHLRLIKAVEPTETNGKYFIMSGKNRLPVKIKLVNKLSDFKHPSLKEARRFLKKSWVMDSMEKIGGNDYLVRIQKLVKRMKKGVKTKKKIIKNLEADLKQAIS